MRNKNDKTYLFLYDKNPSDLGKIHNVQLVNIQYESSLSVSATISDKTWPACLIISRAMNQATVHFCNLKGACKKTLCCGDLSCLNTAQLTNIEA